MGKILLGSWWSLVLSLALLPPSHGTHSSVPSFWGLGSERSICPGGMFSLGVLAMCSQEFCVNIIPCGAWLHTKARFFPRIPCFNLKRNISSSTLSWSGKRFYLFNYYVFRWCPLFHPMEKYPQILHVVLKMWACLHWLGASMFCSS